MKRSELEKYIEELSPELQEKARQCKDMKELNALLAENDVELSEDALKAVAGGCTHECTEVEDIEVKRWLFYAEADWVYWYKRRCKDCGAISYACRDQSSRFAMISEQQYNDMYCPFFNKCGG